MASAAEKLTYSPEQYLALERKSPAKSEYVDGCIYAMSGASRGHNLVAINLAREVSAQLLNRPCEAYVADMRVCSDATRSYTYPDLVVVCGEPAFQDDQFDTLLNPTVILEVLSPSTEAYDRGTKFAHYRRLASLQEYVLVAQDQILVERYTRQGDDWLLTELTRLDDVLRLASIDCAVPLEKVYAKVRFPAEQSGPKTAEGGHPAQPPGR